MNSRLPAHAFTLAALGATAPGALSVQPQPAAQTVAESFNDADALKALGPIARPNNFSIVDDPAERTNTAVRVTFAKDDHYGGSFSIRTAEHPQSQPDRVYFRYRLYIDPSWQPRHTGKLPGFGGTYNTAGWGGKPSDGTNGWSARGMFGPIDAEGRMPIGSYIYHADMVEQGQTYGTGEWWDARLKHGRWYTIEQEIRLDTVGEHGGNADGWLKAWVDGVLVFDRKQLHLRDTDLLRIERVWANFYYGGKTPTPATMSLLIDDLAVASTRPEPARTRSRPSN